jgi:hypothetical protein
LAFNLELWNSGTLELEIAGFGFAGRSGTRELARRNFPANVEFPKS